MIKKQEKHLILINWKITLLNRFNTSQTGSDTNISQNASRLSEPDPIMNPLSNSTENAISNNTGSGYDPIINM